MYGYHPVQPTYTLSLSLCIMCMIVFEYDFSLFRVNARKWMRNITKISVCTWNERLQANESKLEWSSRLELSKEGRFGIARIDIAAPVAVAETKQFDKMGIAFSVAENSFSISIMSSTRDTCSSSRLFYFGFRISSVIRLLISLCK